MYHNKITTSDYWEVPNIVLALCADNILKAFFKLNNSSDNLKSRVCLYIQIILVQCIQIWYSACDLLHYYNDGSVIHSELPAKYDYGRRISNLASLLILLCTYT